MKSSIFIPKKINVGFQNRTDTYTKKLAYVIYFDEKGTLRKETSWQNWRDKSIEPIEFNNIPISGFVLNKKVGDYCSDWNHRQAYVRIYDSRDFEFEITIENLLYILENASSIKGKGLEGDFVYGWDGKDLLLMPIESPDYKEIEEYNTIVFENKSIKAKELVIGATYKTKNNEDLIYLGKYDYYEYSNSNEGKRFWFYCREASYNKFVTMKSIPKNKLIYVVDTNCCGDYADLFDEMECYYNYSPVDNSKDEYVNYNLDYFTEIIIEKMFKNTYFWSNVKVYCDFNDKPNTLVTIKREDKDNENMLTATAKSKRLEKYKPYSYYYTEEREREVEYEEVLIKSNSIEEIFNKLQPKYKNIYLTNGKLRGGNKNNE